MFSMWWTRPHKGPVRTLRLIHSPLERGLGVYEDEDGVRWDVRAIMRDHVCARRIADAPGFYSTAAPVDNFGANTGNMPNPIHEWLPYRVEVVQKGRPSP